MQPFRPNPQKARRYCVEALQIARINSWQPALVMLVLLLAVGNASAQTTAFTYQGKLTDNGNPASGQYDFAFKLFDAVTLGTQQGATISVPNVLVSAGIFTVQLDFGAAAFPGADRFLEIGVRPTGGATFTVLAPRQPVSATPYTVRSMTAGTADTATNATQLGGLAASGFVQNATAQQAGVNFNIGGTGTADILNAQTQFNLAGSRILSNAGTNNLFIGAEAGASNTTGTDNVFVGFSAGQSNTIGIGNSFVGSNAGRSTTGFVNNNSFFGASAGRSNTSGCCNSFFGTAAGFNNTTGGDNAFFGNDAGADNTTGIGNAFYGRSAGRKNTTAGSNAFFGNQTGFNNTTGQFNAFFGRGAGFSNTDANANSFFGNSAGFNNTTGQQNAFFGEGTGSANTTGSGNTFIGRDADFDVANPTGNNNTLIGTLARVVSGVNNSTAIGFGARVDTSNTIVLGSSGQVVKIPGSLDILGATLNLVSPLAQFRMNSLPVFSVFGTDNLLAGVGAIGAGNNTGSQNSFLGARAGDSNTTGNGNTFVGADAGERNLSGSNNTFIGMNAGSNGVAGSNNVMIGANANQSLSTTVNNSVAIGAGTTVSASNTIVLGNSSHTTVLPGKLVTGLGSGIIGGGGGYVETFAITGFFGLFTGNLVLSNLNNVLPSTQHACLRGQSLPPSTGGNSISFCTSSLASVKTKSDVRPFTGGLELINRLQPVAFKWKDGGASDIGLIAEEVAEVEPQLVTRNSKGEVEDVKEHSLTVFFINAFKEQQALIKQQQQQIEALKKLVCADHPEAEVCK